jgi:hypothetical protein
MDILFRTRQQLMEKLGPQIGAIANDPQANAELKQLLANNPPWRKPLLFYLTRNVSDPRTPLDLFLSLKDTANPPTAAELSDYLDVLLNKSFYDLAYYTWLQFLPPEQLGRAGHLFNGSFEDVPTGLPFDWSFGQKSGVAIQIAARPDREGERALLLEFGPGRVAELEVKQVTALSPGTYHFRGTHKADIVSERGLLWRITCAAQPTRVLGESPSVSGTEPNWTGFEFSFAVPESDCPAQYVTLSLNARSASEQFVSGSIWYDDLQILREATEKPQAHGIN